MNMESRQKFKEIKMNEPVVFWKWISSNTLALVTATHVYHWYMNNQADPQKVRARPTRAHNMYTAERVCAASVF